jgi:hypothetical protein
MATYLKVNIAHLVGRIQEGTEQLQRGDALEARDLNVLLTKEMIEKHFSNDDSGLVGLEQLNKTKYRLWLALPIFLTINYH